MSSTRYDAIIVGAGLAGLSAAVWLKRIGYNILVIDKSDDIGGKLRSDIVDGYTLDRGFQVFLTAYPEAKRILQYNELGLKDFSPGAVLLHEGKKVVLHDPFKNPSKMPKMLFFKLATLGDKFRLLQLRMRLNKMSYSDIFEQYEAKTSTVLTKKKFSKKFIQSFLKPFFSGIFLENSLETSRRMFEFVFKMMSEGNISQPEKGIAAIAKQLGSELAEGSIRLNTEVAKINTGKVELTSGEIIEGRNIIVATDAHAPFLEKFRMSRKFDYVGGTTLYFSTDKAPADHKMIMLNTASDKLSNLVVVMSNINPALAPNGKHLIAVSINGIPSVSDNILEEGVRNELKAYFDTAQWNLLRIYRINHALPKQNSVLGDIMPARFILNDGVYICGDYLLNGSQNAALRMGRKVAQRIMKDERSGLKKNRKKKKYSKFFEKE